MVDTKSARAPAVSSTWSSAAVGGLVVWVGVRGVVAVISLVARWVHQGPVLTDPAGGGAPDNAGDGFFALLHHWDSNYYLAIASDGYFPAGGAPKLAAFFPGYPLAARGLSEAITLGSPTSTSLALSLGAVSAVSSLLAAVVLWRLVDITSAAGVAPLATLMFLAGPYSVFLFANYSESLFVAFAIAAWYCGLRDRWWLAGLWCALATATRINGCFLLAALIVMYVAHRRRDRLALAAPASAWVIVAGSGVLAYFGYLAVRTGDLLAWSAAQAEWGRQLHWPWQAFYQTAGRVLYASSPDRRLQFALDIVAVAAIVIAVVVWIRRRDWPPAVYAGLTVIALTTSFTFVSVARNSVTLFPLTILLAAMVRQSTRRPAAAVLFACWTGLFLVNTTLFAFGYWTD